MKLSKPSPADIATAFLMIGIALAVIGVYILAGHGWACLAGAVSFISVAVLMFRGA